MLLLLLLPSDNATQSLVLLSLDMSHALTYVII